MNFLWIRFKNYLTLNKHNKYGHSFYTQNNNNVNRVLNHYLKCNVMYMINERFYGQLKFWVNDHQNSITSNDIRVDLYLTKSCIFTQARVT